MKKKRYGTPTINFSLIKEVICVSDSTNLEYESDEELE